MRNHRIAFLLLMAIGVCHIAFAREFIHVITSKGIYETCEDLWFKAIAIADSTMCLSNRSHTAYVEIVDPSDSVVWKAKYKMTNGMCDGQVFVGDDWKSGEYRMFVHTHASLSKADSLVYPKRLLIVGELPEAPGFIETAKKDMQYIELPDSTRNVGLNVSVALDSTEYHTRSKIKATVKIADAEGNPVHASIAISVADALYSYPPADVDIQSQCYGMTHSMTKSRRFEPFLSDAPVWGRIEHKNKKDTSSLDGVFINVFDEIARKGKLNIIQTGQGGYFYVPSEMASSLGRILLFKPLGDVAKKPHVVLDEPFKHLELVRKNAVEKSYPTLRQKHTIDIIDSADFSSRRIMRLDEVVVNAKSGRFLKRNKVIGYLDSLALDLETAWTCGCPAAGGNTTYLNDYVKGYTHHPDGFGTPVKIGKPERGVQYELIEYSGGTANDYVTDIRYIEYNGPQYTEEELLRMHGLTKAEGYYPKRRFQIPPQEELVPGIEDSRNTLLWIPRSQTDSNGEFTIEFPASDIKSTFKFQITVIMPCASDAVTHSEYFKVI